jgi:phosphoribosylaminoimidazole carboxylase (NCAIR synthetase)
VWQVAPNQIYVARKVDAVTPGMELTFYSAYTMDLTGEATVVAAVLNDDEAVTHQLWEALQKAQILTWDVVPYLVTLDRDLQISELEIVDYKQVCPAGIDMPQPSSQI